MACASLSENRLAHAAAEARPRAPASTLPASRRTVEGTEGQVATGSDLACADSDGHPRKLNALPAYLTRVEPAGKMTASVVHVLSSIFEDSGLLCPRRIVCG